MNILPGHIDGRPYRVVKSGGWVVRSANGDNAYDPGWRWNSRSSARAFKWECEYFGHKPPTPTPAPREEE